jgi:hypothetical protein
VDVNAPVHHFLFSHLNTRFPEGTVLLLKHVKFNGWYKEKMQLGFSDSDGNYDMNISKADDHLDITKKIKTWFSLNGDIKLLTIDEIRRKVRGTMVFSVRR